MKDERFSKNKKRYFTVDIRNVTERGLDKLVRAFNASNAKVADVIATNKQYRQDGLAQKKAQFIFENGQSVTILFTEQGDIAITKMNGRVRPVNNMSSENAYAKEMASKMAANQPQFDKALARKAKAAIKDVSGLKPVSRSINVRIKEAESALAVAVGRVRVTNETLSAEQDKANAAQNSVDQVKSKLSQLKDEIEQLIRQLQAKKSELRGGASE